MTTVLIVRRHAASARRLQAQFETSRDLRVCAVTSTLAEARKLIARHDPEVLVTDLSVEDGAALRLIAELRNGDQSHEWRRVMVLADRPLDGLLFGTLCAGADSFHVDGTLSPSAVSTLLRTLRGEAAMNAPLAQQILNYFGLDTMLRLPASGDDRSLDWTTDADNPVRLTQGEQRMLVLLARGEPVGGVAVRTGQSFESVGRRIAAVYRKLQWDLRSGALTPRAA